MPSDAVIVVLQEAPTSLPQLAQTRLGALLQGLNGAALRCWNDFNAGKAGPKAAATLAAGDRLAREIARAIRRPEDLRQFDAIAGKAKVTGGGANVAGAVAWIVVALALIALIIEKTKDNKLQEWLARSHFGSAPDKYDSVELERAQLKLAFE